jgi:hypothetical protein
LWSSLKHKEESLYWTVCSRFVGDKEKHKEHRDDSINLDFGNITFSNTTINNNISFFLDEDLQQEKREIDTIQLELSFACNNAVNVQRESNSSVTIKKKCSSPSNGIPKFTEDQYKQLDEQLRNVRTLFLNFFLLVKFFAI